MRKLSSVDVLNQKIRIVYEDIEDWGECILDEKLIKLNKSLPVVKDLIEESETLNSRRKDLKIKSLVAQRQLERSKRSDGNNE